MTLADQQNEFELQDCPRELISAVKFGPNSNQFLLASSWDGSVRLYDIKNNAMRNRYNHQAPVLDCCFKDNGSCWSGGLDCQVRAYDFNTSAGSILVGRHDGAIKCIEFSPEVNAVISGGWDSLVKVWDPRSNSADGTYNQPDKVYTMALCGMKLIVGTAGRRVVVWDLRNMGYPEQRRESSLKYQTRCIRCFPNHQGYALSSIEGRVAVEYLDPSPEYQKKKYAFKCHRIKENNGVESIYPVNAIAFHSGYNTFATGGSDGYVYIWDSFNKKRLCQFHQYPTHISSLAFSPDGNTLAIAASYIYESDMKDTVPPDTIYIKSVTDQETKPK